MFSSTLPRRPWLPILAAILALLLSGLPAALPSAQAAGAISLTGFGIPYTQDFNTLASSGTSSTVPSGWDFFETGTNANALYTAGTGSSTAGDTYSFGDTSNIERAFGGLLSGSLTPLIGAQFTNNTGGTITSMNIAYTGEQWRVGVTNCNAADRLDFQLSTDAASLNTGTWADYDGLDFSSPMINATAGALNGNASGNRTTLSLTISGLSIANGSSFWICWADFNISSSDDGLSVDDFSLTPSGAVLPPTLTINDVSANEGNSGATAFNFTVSLTSPAGPGGVTFDIATQDNSATVADNDYVANSLIGQTIPAGSSNYSFSVLVNGDTIVEPEETFFVNVANVTGATVVDGQGQGTIQDDDVPSTPSLTVNDVSISEGNSGTTTFTFVVGLSSPAGAGGVTFDIATADNTASSPSDFTAKGLTGQAIPAGGSTYTFDVLVNGDTAAEPDETFFVNVMNVVGAPVGDGQGQGTIVNDDVCGLPYTPIYDIQGSGATVVLPGTQTTEGVVVGDYEGPSPALRGFFIQDLTGDGNPGTSDGIFVFEGSNANTVNLGDIVRVTGTVGENQGQSQISVGTIVNCGTGAVTPTDITFPVASSDFLEQYEGMLVRLPQTMVVTEHFQLGRFNQVVLSAGNKLKQPTNVVSPGAAALALQAQNNLNKVIMDDASQAQNPDPIVFGRGGQPLSASNTLRGGDTATNIVGVMTYTWAGNAASGNAYRVRPIGALTGNVNFVEANSRPASAPAVGGNVKVVGINLLNFFNTFADNNAGTPGCFPSGTDADCRGANSATEFARQYQKTVSRDPRNEP